MEYNHIFMKRAYEIAEELIQYRRHFHQNPEVGMNTTSTAAFVAEKLEEMGYDPQLVNECGVTATVGKSEGKVLLLRADMDALPMQEDSGLEFASQVPGAAHCCGHDLHTAMLLGAARILKEEESSLEGTVKLMFQPAEENMQGARAMIQAGILENPTVDAAMAIHVNSIAVCGRLLVFAGPTCASSDLFKITIKGHGGHGARPEETVDPLNVMAHIHTALQELQARELRAGETGVLTIGCMKGGSTYNVIPNDAVMMGTIRTYNKEIREMLITRMQEIATGVAKVFRAEAAVVFSDNYTIPLVSDKDMAVFAVDSLKNILPEEQVLPMRKSFPGSEDFAFIADKVPTLFIVLGATIQKGVEYGQHHPKVRFNEECLPVGAATYAYLASEWLRNNK
ncbi:MAG: amidohydrolase [Coprococcus sp.]|nr:amidohydrolase [Coprococcus sp.]